MHLLPLCRCFDRCNYWSSSPLCILHLIYSQTEARIQILENEHCEKLREEDAKHREELEQAVIQLSSNLKEDFNKIMADLKASHEEEKAQMKKDFKKVKRDALDDLREELASDYNIQMKEMRGELEHDKVADIAKVVIQLFTGVNIHNNNKHIYDLSGEHLFTRGNWTRGEGDRRHLTSTPHFILLSLFIIPW